MLDLTHIPQDLVMEFFATFARFEYALKRGSYLQSTSDARPDWNKFVKELDDIPDENKLLVLAVAPYLKSHPPKKQVSDQGVLKWQKRCPAASDIESLVDSVKTVRNNLFHGGKYPEGPIDEPARDEQLLRESVRVLQVLLEQRIKPCRTIAKHFYEPLG